MKTKNDNNQPTIRKIARIRDDATGQYTEIVEFTVSDSTTARLLVIYCIGFGALHAQTNAPAAYWVTETLEVSDQAALLKVITAVPPTIRPFGGHYIVLGGKIAPGEGSPPRRITIIAFDSLEKAQQWFNSPAAAAARAEAQKFAKIRSYIVEGVAN
jgi:uncharacterized protein (DUF1330 family)